MTEFLFLQQSTAPGREGQQAPAQPAQPAPGQPSQGAPTEPAAKPPGGFDPTMILLFLAPLLLFFFMSRSQSKKQKQLESSLKTGDRVVTRGGMIGKIISMDERTAKIEIAPGVNVQVVKTSIDGLDGGDKAAEAKAKDEKAAPAKDEKSKDAGKDKPQDKKA